MLAPDLVQPRKVASAVVISSSLSSVTFPDPSPGRRAGRPPGPGRGERLGRLGAPILARRRCRSGGRLGGEADEHAATGPGGSGRRRVKRRRRKRRAEGDAAARG